MRWTLTLLAATVGAVAPAAGPLTKGTPTIKAISALAFAPDGTLFIADPQAATITAVATGDTTPAAKSDVMIDKLGDKLGSAVGTTGDNITVADVKVNPASGNIFAAVTRGMGQGSMPVVLKIGRDGTVSEFALTDVPFAQVGLPNAKIEKRMEAITGIAFVDNKVVVAGLSNEDFASTLRVIPYPFTKADKGAGIEIFHAAHGRLETNSPIRTFTPYKLNGADYLMAAYTCTPLVKLPLADLKDGAKVKGTTIAELGNRNRPLDMIVYQKDGKDYVLMANSARGVMKIPAAGFADAEPITARVGGGGTAGVKFDTIKELEGVVQLDKLDDGRALILVQNGDKSLTLKSVPLP
jgi:hypothetical protein